MKILERYRRLEKFQRYSIIVLIIAIALRFLLIIPYTVSGDACWHLSAAEYIAENKEIPLHEQLGRDEPFWAPPLFHLLGALAYMITAPINEEIGLKLLAPLFGSGTLIVAWLLFRPLFSPVALFAATTFLGFLPISLDYSILGYTDGALTFFITLSLYFVFRGQVALSGISLGLAVLTKYSGVVAIPVVLGVLLLRNKERIPWRDWIMVCAIPVVISLPWFIRNWVTLGNPVWPFLNFLFQGFERKSYSAIDPSNLVSLKTYAATYLGFFGIPDGNIDALASVSIPYLPLLLSIFLLGTAIFLVPLLFGFSKNRDRPAFLLLLGLFILLFLIYVLNVGPLVARILLPAIVALAFFYGRGFDTLIRLAPRMRPILVLGLLLLASGFVMAVAGKIVIAEQAWDFYKEDFEWVKKNTPDDARFLIGGQCLQYHLDRDQVYPGTAQQGSEDYIWINERFSLDPRSILDSKSIRYLTDGQSPVYENTQTGTAIFASKD